MNKDLTIGNPGSVLWRFCLPLFGSVIFQQLYNIADSFIAGRFIGENALAAVGNSYEITLIFIGFAFGCNIGCSVITSKYFGAKDFGRMKSAISTAMISSGVVCLTLMLIGLLGGPLLLHLIRTPAEVYADSELYLRIYTMGLPFVFFYNLSTGLFSAMGDSRTPFVFLAFSSIANIGVDLLFVRSFHMGVAGVAWATFLCQGVSCTLALLSVLRRLRTSVSGKLETIFSKSLLIDFVEIAVPSILQQTFISFGNIIIQAIINGFGPGVMAGYSAAIKLNNLVITSFSTLGTGVSNYTSQNLGAGKFERISQGMKAGIKLVWLISIPILVLYSVFPEQLLRFFMDDPSEDALRSGMIFLRIVVPFYYVVSIKIIADSVLRGVGQMRSFMISTFTDLILRVVLSAVLSSLLVSSTGIWLSWPIGWTMGTLLSTYFYRKWHRTIA